MPDVQSRTKSITDYMKNHIRACFDAPRFATIIKAATGKKATDFDVNKLVDDAMQDIFKVAAKSVTDTLSNAYGKRWTDDVSEAFHTALKEPLKDYIE